MASKEPQKFLESVSTRELERRWSAVREAMKERDIDFLIARNGTDILGGYVKWLSNVGAKNDYPVTVLFPRDDDMVVIKHGPRGSTNPGLPGIKKQYGVPVLPSLQYSITYDAQVVVEELAKHKNSHIGMVGMGFIPVAFYNHLTKQLASAKFSDAGDMVDGIKAIKSDEEIEHLRTLAEAQDKTVEYILSRVTPGIQIYEIYADLMHQCLLTGSTTANLIVYSQPANGPRQSGGPARSKVIEKGDLVRILVESNGASGYFTEISSFICFGKVPDALQEQYNFAQDLQRKLLGLLKPGADSLTIWNTYNELLKKGGYAEEKRIGAHGMGLDMVERPCLQFDETMKIQAGMCIAAHSTPTSALAATGVVENYIIKKTGMPECLHHTPQRINVL